MRKNEQTMAEAVEELSLATKELLEAIKEIPLIEKLLDVLNGVANKLEKTIRRTK